MIDSWVEFCTHELEDWSGMKDMRSFGKPKSDGIHPNSIRNLTEMASNLLAITITST